MEKIEVARFEVIAHRDESGTYHVDATMKGQTAVLVFVMVKAIRADEDMKELIRMTYELSL